MDIVSFRVAPIALHKSSEILNVAWAASSCLRKRRYVGQASAHQMSHIRG